MWSKIVVLMRKLRSEILRRNWSSVLFCVLILRIYLHAYVNCRTFVL